MAFKNKEDQAKYHREIWYPKNKARRIELNSAWQKKQKDLYREWKNTLSCEICGEDEYCTLDFHHKDPKQKDREVSKLVRDNLSFQKILEEADKCAVLCSNCHRKVHAGIAQLKEHLTCNENVEGLIPSTGSNTLM